MFAFFVRPSDVTNLSFLPPPGASCCRRTFLPPRRFLHSSHGQHPPGGVGGGVWGGGGVWVGWGWGGWWGGGLGGGGGFVYSSRRLLPQAYLETPFFGWILFSLPFFSGFCERSQSFFDKGYYQSRLQTRWRGVFLVWALATTRSFFFRFAV